MLDPPLRMCHVNEAYAVRMPARAGLPLRLAGERGCIVQPDRAPALALMGDDGSQ